MMVLKTLSIKVRKWHDNGASSWEGGVNVLVQGYKICKIL